VTSTAETPKDQKTTGFEVEEIDPIAIAVHDLDAAIHAATTLLGAKLLWRNPPKERAINDGAVLELGGMLIVFEHPLTDRGIFAEFVKRRGEGIHHIGVSVTNLDQAMKDADVAKLIQRTSEVRGIPLEKLNFYRDMILSDVVNAPRGKTAHEWAARQCYIALGNLMTCAAVLGVDACPMEGLVPAEYDRVLNLNGSGFKTVVACALGYRAATDKYASLAKVRFEKNHLVRVI